MEYTNKYNLPESIANALMCDDYDLSDAPDNIISVTTLIDSPKAKLLQKRHYNELTVDVSESVWKLFGSSIHHVLNMSNQVNGEQLSEERWFLCCGSWDIYTLNKGDKAQEQSWYEKSKWYVSGKFDNYIKESVEDYKVTSVWSYIYSPYGKPEHHSQININAIALRLMGFPVDNGRIIMILRDFQNSKAGKDNYPAIPIQTINIPLWDNEKIINYIEDRIKLYSECVKVGDDEIPVCSKEERWYNSGKCAVMKEGRKSALKLFAEDQRGEAEKFMGLQTGGKFYIEDRPGKNNRCEGYCPQNIFCDFWKELDK